MGESNQELFINKLAVSALVVNKEGQLMNSYMTILNKIRKGQVGKQEITTKASFFDCWGICLELYMFLSEKFDKLKDKDLDNFNKLKTLVEKYERTEQDLKFEELEITVGLLVRFVIQFGFHNVDRMDNTEEDDF